MALLGDGHDQPDGVSELAPRAERAQGAVDPDHDPDRVIRVHVGRVQAPLLQVVVLDGGGCRASQARTFGAALFGGEAFGHLATRHKPTVCVRVRGVEEGGLCGVHVDPEEVEQRLAEALGKVGGAVGAESQTQLGDEDELAGPRLGVAVERAPDGRHGGQIARLGEEDDPQFMQFALGHGELVEVVPGVVPEAVDRSAEQVSRALKDGEVSHELRQVGLELLVPLGHRAAKLVDSGGGRQAARPQPRQHLWPRVADEVLRHVEDEGGGVDGDGGEAAEVVGGHSRATALSSAPVSVELELARGGALRIEVHRPEGEVWKEVVPAEAAHSAQLLAHRLVSLRERDKVRHEHRLQLDVGVEPGAFEQVGHEVLVRVVSEPTPQVRQVEVRVDGRTEVEQFAAGTTAVPDAPTRPRVELELTDGECAGAIAALSAV